MRRSHIHHVAGLGVLGMRSIAFRRMKKPVGKHMNFEITHNLTMALRPWLAEAIEHIKKRPETIHIMRKCAEGAGDVRVVFHIRENAITVEVIDYSDNTVAEIFRQLVTPGDSGTVSPDSGQGP